MMVPLRWSSLPSHPVCLLIWWRLLLESLILLKEKMLMAYPSEFTHQWRKLYRGNLLWRWLLFFFYFELSFFVSLHLFFTLSSCNHLCGFTSHLPLVTWSVLLRMNEARMSTIREVGEKEKKNQQTNRVKKKLGKEEFSFFVEKCLKDLKKEIKGIISFPPFLLRFSST